MAVGQRVGTGSFDWDGAYGTHFWVDPTEDIVGVVMIQTPNFQVSRDVENALMQASSPWWNRCRTNDGDVPARPGTTRDRSRTLSTEEE